MGWEELQSGKAVEFQIAGLVNYAHSTAAQLLQDLVVRYGLADHGWGRGPPVAMRPTLPADLAARTSSNLKRLVLPDSAGRNKFVVRPLTVP
jgi:hypothetical protein